MKRSTAVLLPILIFTLLALQGCNKKEEKNSFETTQTQSSQSISVTQNEQQHREQNDAPAIPGAKPYRLSDYRESNITVSIDGNDRLYLDNAIQPVVIFTFFSSWSHPSKSQLAYLNDLQNKYSDALTVIGILLNPQSHVNELEALVKETGTELYLSKSKENNDFTRHILSDLHLPDFMPVPLTVIYHHGLYYRHYEGAVPIEMIEHDIKKIIQ